MTHILVVDDDPAILRTLTINLRAAGAREIVHALAKDADIVIEGFRPGVMARMGIGYDALKAINRGIYVAQVLAILGAAFVAFVYVGNPKAKDGAFKTVRVGFRGKDLAAVEIVDAFDQRSLLQFSQFAAGVAIPPESFQFKPPAGADVIEQ